MDFLSKRRGSYMSFELFSHYQVEIIAALAVIVLLILYMLLKKRPKKKETLLEIQPAVIDEYETEGTKPQKKQHDIYDLPAQETQEKKPESQDKEPQTEENLPSEEKPKEQPAPVQTQPTEFIPKFNKQPVPPHGKIKKEDFAKFSGRRILLAEDNIINQKVILGLLSGSGIDVVIANDGQEALNILEEDDNFMLILMDAHMPNVDGFEATKIIRKNPRYDHIVVVALSGDTASDDIKKMKDAGMSETLEKPLKIDAFYDILYAYNTAKQKQTQQTSQESSIKLLNTQEGLNICTNDKELYKDVLKEFLSDYSNSFDILNKFIQEKKYDEADKLLLDITGVAANLGAQRLHNIALTAKEILKTEAKDLSSTLQAYKEALEETLNAIKHYIQEK